MNASLTVALAIALVLVAPQRGRASAPTWPIGMSTALSGPAKALGVDVRVGIEAWFAVVNARGGVHGRPIELIARDDAYEPAQTAKNMRSLIERDHVFAVIGNVGTPTAAVAVPIASEHHVPFFGAFTGAGLLRKTPPDRYVVNYRASYAEETEEIVRGLVDELGVAPSEIGFFTQADAYGDAGWSGAVRALERRGFVGATLLPHGRYPRNTADVEDGLSRLLDPRVTVRAVIMVGAYKPCARFIMLAQEHGLQAVFVNMSFVGSDALAHELGPIGEGVVVTQVVPMPDGDTPAARALQAALPPDQRNFVTFEGFVAARAFVAVLERAGPNATSETFIDALESSEGFDIGLDTTHVLSRMEHQFSHSVWPTVIRGGRFVPLKWSELRSAGRGRRG